GGGGGAGGGGAVGGGGGGGGGVSGSRGSGAPSRGRYGPIANYAVNAYDWARPVLLALKTAARQKGGLPTRGEVVAALRAAHFQGIAYARPVAWDAKGDNAAAVIFLNALERAPLPQLAAL